MGLIVRGALQVTVVTVTVKMEYSMLISRVTRTPEASNHRLRVTMHRNAAIFELVQAFVHMLLP